MSEEPPDAASVADRLHSAAIHLLRQLRRQDDAAGLTPARMSALSVVVFAGPVTIGQLATAEQVSAPTMTRLVEALESEGLVKRSADQTDGRRAWLAATARGRRVLQEGRLRRVTMLANELGQLDSSKLALLDEASVLLELVNKRMVSKG